MVDTTSDFQAIIEKLVSYYHGNNVTIDKNLLYTQADKAKQVYDSILDGKVVFLEAPPNSGKTEVLLAVFLRLRDDGIGRMYLVEPMHSLINLMEKRIRKSLEGFGLSKYVGADHGRLTEKTFLYKSPITITTPDSYFYGFASTRVKRYRDEHHVEQGRYSMPVGLQTLSFTVFDEAHLIQDEVFLSPRLMAINIAVTAAAGSPVVVASATMPETFKRLIKDILSELSIDINTVNFSSARKRIVKLNLVDDGIEENSVDCGKRSLIILNTIRKAQEFYVKLKKECSGTPVYLIHSLMTDSDKQKRLKEIMEHFGKTGGEPGIVVSTQVMEAGVDLDFQELHTEIAPIDSLIQRLGRVGRRGGYAEAYIYGLASPPKEVLPYNNISEIIECTQKTLKETGTTTININDPKFIQCLLNEVYDEYIVKSLAEKGDSLLMKAIEYVESLGPLTYPPREELAFRPSTYFEIALVPDENCGFKCGGSTDLNNLNNYIIRLSRPLTDDNTIASASGVLRFRRILEQALGDESSRIFIYNTGICSEMRKENINSKKFTPEAGTVYIFCLSKDTLSKIYDGDMGLHVKSLDTQSGKDNRANKGRGR